MLMSLFLSVIARLLLISEPVFQLGLECVSSSEGKSTPEVLTRLLEVMCNKILYIVQPERKKLISIALLKLMSTADKVRLLVMLATMSYRLFWYCRCSCGGNKLSHTIISLPFQVILHHVCGIFLAVSETLNDILKTDLSGKTVEYVFPLLLLSSIELDFRVVIYFY